MRNAPSGGRPVLPGHILKHDHHVFAVKTFARHGLDDVANNLLLYFDASTDGQQNLDKDKIVGARPAQIGKRRIESEIIRVQLNDAVNAIVRVGPRADKSRSDGIEHNILECACLWLAHGNCYDWHFPTHSTDEA